MRARVGVVGLGKLGLPMAITLALRGHPVVGYDHDPGRMSTSALSTHECAADRIGPLIHRIGPDLPMCFAPLPELLDRVDCVLVAVETPHGPEHEGITPLPDTRSDFDYRALVDAVRAVVAAAPWPLEIGIVSTVLPGTVRRLVLPLAGAHPLVYCPLFVSMGQVAADLLAPEFVLVGRDAAGPTIVRDVFAGLSDAPVHDVSIESAELAKVAYNTFVSAKVTLSNVVQRMAHEVGADAAAVFGVLRSADRRLAGPAYIGPGMADGGPCHPRDNIALSWLLQRTGAVTDLFTDLMRNREAYVEWLAEQFVALAGDRRLVLLGTAYKPGTDLRTGSSAVLLATVLRRLGRSLTVVDDPADLVRVDPGPAAFFLGCPEPAFVAHRWPAGSVVVDPWQVVDPSDGVTVHRIGAAATVRGPGTC